MANVVRAALVQATWTGDTESMVAKHEEHAREAARQGARIIGFQEVFNAPYFCQVQEPEHYSWAEPVPDGPTVRRMQQLARETGMVIVVPVFEIEQDGFYYNTAAVIDADGTFLGKYRKHHIPQVKGFWEKYYFRPGNAGWPVFDTAVGKVGVYICYDRHFPEGWRQLGLNGAQLVYNPSATSRGLSAYLWQLEQPQPPSPTSTSSPRSTVWDRRSTGTTTSTGRRTSSTRGAGSSARSPATRTRNSSCATWTSG